MKGQLLSIAVACLITGSAHGGGESETVSTADGMEGDYQVTMTWVSGANRYATIDGEFYTVGDQLPDGARVHAIESGVVTIARDGQAGFVEIVKQPPSSRPPPYRIRAMNEAEPLPSSTYIDDAIKELDRELDAGADTDADRARLDALGSLRDRLVAARERQAGEPLSDEQRQRLELALGQEWLLAQRKFDPLRRHVLDSGGPLGMAELHAARQFLEDAALAALGPSLTQIDPSALAALDDGRPNTLLDTVKRLFGSYPDYHALADQLEQLDAATASTDSSSLQSLQEFDSDPVNSFGTKPNGE